MMVSLFSIDISAFEMVSSQLLTINGFQVMLETIIFQFLELTLLS